MLPSSRNPADQTGKIIFGYRRQSFALHRFESASAIVSINGQRPASPTTNNQIVPAIAIDVEPGESRPKFGQAVRHLRLRSKTNEGIFVMVVIE
jgi:hypothetical protein